MGHNSRDLIFSPLLSAVFLLLQQYFVFIFIVNKTHLLLPSGAGVVVRVNYAGDERGFNPTFSTG